VVRLVWRSLLANYFVASHNMTQSVTEMTTKRDLEIMRIELSSKLTLIQWMLGILLAGVISLVMKSFFAA
jgi:hypothetical protein